MSKLIQAIIGLLLMFLGIPSKGGIIIKMCYSLTEQFQNILTTCWIGDIMLFIAGIGLVIEAVFNIK